MDLLRTPIRDHVTFRAVVGEVVEPSEAAADFVRHVRLGAKTRSPQIRVRPHRSSSGAVTVRVYWQGDRFHTIKIASTLDGCLLARHNVAADGILSPLLQEWLTASDRFADICWRTRDEWKNGAPGFAAPA